MDRKAITVTGLIICIVIFIGIFAKCRHNSIEPKPYPIDSLLIANDSLNVCLDSIDMHIIDINEWYEKTYGIVLNQSTDSDLLFFEGYLSKTNQRFFGSDYDTTVKTN